MNKRLFPVSSIIDQASFNYTANYYPLYVDSIKKFKKCYRRQSEIQSTLGVDQTNSAYVVILADTLVGVNVVMRTRVQLTNYRYCKDVLIFKA